MWIYPFSFWIISTCGTYFRHVLNTSLSSTYTKKPPCFFYKNETRNPFCWRKWIDGLSEKKCFEKEGVDTKHHFIRWGENDTKFMENNNERRNLIRNIILSNHDVSHNPSFLKILMGMTREMFLNISFEKSSWVVLGSHNQLNFSKETFFCKPSFICSK